MNILITAGGTTERIDSVRSITNSGTGRLGSLIADNFGANPQVDRVFYVCGLTAQRPATKKAVVTPIEGTDSLEAAVRDILTQNTIDAVIHSMAVSDYKVRKVTTAEHVAISAEQAFYALSGHPETRLRELSVIIKNADGFDRSKKISSAEKNLVVFLDPTIKVISLFKNLAPNAVLVGFKLLDSVPHEELINAAVALMEKNSCDFLLANDSRDIHDEIHIGYLLDKALRERRFETKAEIADGIASAVVSAIKGVTTT